MKLILLLCISLNVLAFTYSTRIEDLGFNKGISNRFETDSQTVYFDLPSSNIIKSAKLNLDLFKASFLAANSYIRVNVNGQNLGFVTGNQSEIGIPKKLINSEQLKVSFHFYAKLALSSLCPTSKAYNGLWNIKENSSLDLELKHRPKMINDFLLTLPRKVLITKSSRDLSEREFTFLVLLKRFLLKSNKELVFTDSFESEASLFLGSSSEIEDYYKQFNNKHKDFESVIKRYYAKSFSFLAFNSDYLDESLSRIELFSNTFNTSSISTLKDLKVNPISNKTIVKRIDEKSWQIRFSNEDLSSPQIIESLDLSVLASSDKDHMNVILNVFKGDKLIKVIELGDMSEPESFHVKIPRGLVSKDSTILIKKVVRSSIPAGPCGAGSGEFISILEDTKVNFTNFNERSNFMSFTRSSIGEFNLHIPKSWLNSFKGGIDHVLRLINSSEMNPQHLKFHYYDQEPLVSMKNNFIFSSTDLKVSGPHKVNANKFNVNRIEIGNYKGEEVLLYQVSNKLLTKSSNLRFIPIEGDDLTYFDSERILYSVNSKVDPTFEVIFSNPQSINSLFKKYKFYIFGLLWILLTFVFIRFAKRKK